MRKRVGLWCVVLLVFFSGLAAADVAAIQADKLPQDSAILAAMRDAADLENYSLYYAQPWKFSISRKEVAKRLSKDLEVLDSAAKQHPENAELLLLTALVAQYAYNVDVENSHEIAMQSLEQAAKRAPGDFRPAWFHASLRCQTNEAKTGGEEFLSIEEGRAWEDLPVAFWDDYIQCATYYEYAGACAARGRSSSEDASACLEETGRGCGGCAGSVRSVRCEEGLRAAGGLGGVEFRCRYGVHEHDVRRAVQSAERVECGPGWIFE